MQSYGTDDVLRILHITARQLTQWQKTGVVPAAKSYSFFDLLQMKKVRDLRARRLRLAMIRESLSAMQRVAGMENPLLETSSFSVGSRIVFRHQGHAMEPIAGQFVMDFSQAEGGVLPARVEGLQRVLTAADYFARGIAMEEDPQLHAEAVEAYQRVLELDPSHAAAYINLGTLHYNRQDYRLAEWHYRKAVEVDPRYALAYFDLGNVLDETGQAEEAIQHYKTALSLAPTYADAHYNLALAYEKTRQFRRALAHWRSYLFLDASGPWASHARGQIRKILQNEPLKIVSRRKL